MMVNFSISEISKRTGISAKTIRYYEDLGLVNPQRAENGYRNYNNEDEHQLLFVKRAKALGLTLKEIAIILQSISGGNCKNAKTQTVELIEDKLSEIDKQIAELTALKNYLREQLDNIASTLVNDTVNKGCSCLG